MPQSKATTRRVAELIELGRDREAAELGSGFEREEFEREEFEREEGEEAVDVLDQLDQLGPVLAGVVGQIRSDQLDNPTPCAEFTVRGVLEHMIGGGTAFAAAFRGVEAAPPDMTDVLGNFAPTLSGLAEAMHAPGALDRTIEAPFGEVPGTTFGRFVVLDGLVHGWDLAVATGQAYEPPDALVGAADEFARQALEPLRDGRTFAAAIEPSPSATPIERLAAFTGRQR